MKNCLRFNLSQMDAILFLCLVSLTCTLLGQLPSAHAIDENPKIAEVFTHKVLPQELSETLTYPAKVVSQVNASILSETDGVVTRILTPLGTSVSRKSALMLIEHTDPGYEYAPIRVTAPVTGAISLVEVTEGSRVVKGQRLAVVTDPAKVRLTVEIAAIDLGFIFKGLTGEFKSAGREDSVPVKVRGVSPLVDPATGTATCELEVDRARLKKSGLLIPGLVGQVNFKANVHVGYSVPEYALIYRDKKTYLRLVADAKSYQVLVTTGKSNRGSIEILEGLHPQDVVIERANGFVADGQAVKTVEAKQ